MEAVYYDSPRRQIYMISSLSSNFTGDTNVLAIVDANTLAPIVGSPFYAGHLDMWGQIAFDSARGKLYTKSIGKLNVFDVATKQFTVLGSGGGGTLRSTGAIYLLDLDLLVLTATYGSYLEIYDGATLLPVSGSPVTLSAQPSGVTYDPQLHQLFVSTSFGINVVDPRTRQLIPGSPFRSVVNGFGEGYGAILKVP